MLKDMLRGKSIAVVFACDDASSVHRVNRTRE